MHLFLALLSVGTATTTADSDSLEIPATASSVGTGSVEPILTPCDDAHCLQQRGRSLLIDRADIADLLTTYARAVDSRDWKLYRSVFTPDARIDYTAAGGIAGTVEEVTEWMGFVFEGVFSATQQYVSLSPPPPPPL